MENCQTENYRKFFASFVKLMTASYTLSDDEHLIAVVLSRAHIFLTNFFHCFRSDDLFPLFSQFSLVSILRFMMRNIVNSPRERKSQQIDKRS